MERPTLAPTDARASFLNARAHWRLFVPAIQDNQTRFNHANMLLFTFGKHRDLLEFTSAARWAQIAQKWVDYYTSIEDEIKAVDQATDTTPFGRSDQATGSLNSSARSSLHSVTHRGTTLPTPFSQMSQGSTEDSFLPPVGPKDESRPFRSTLDLTGYPHNRSRARNEVLPAYQDFHQTSLADALEAPKRVRSRGKTRQLETLHDLGFESSRLEDPGIEFERPPPSQPKRRAPPHRFSTEDDEFIMELRSRDTPVPFPEIAKRMNRTTDNVFSHFYAKLKHAVDATRAGGAANSTSNKQTQSSGEQLQAVQGASSRLRQLHSNNNPFHDTSVSDTIKRHSAASSSRGGAHQSRDWDGTRFVGSDDEEENEYE